MTKDLPEAHAVFFGLTAEDRFLRLMTEITGINSLIADPDLVGGGLHQSLPGAFLDVHVDYNVHPKWKWHRRLNLLLYLNRDWRPEYKGNLELWDMERNTCVAEIEPLFNRAVLFETSKVSYHGHPQPLACPPGMTRKSLAVYYFSEAREDGSSEPESNTQYRNTTGLKGTLKTLRSGFGATVERIREVGLIGTFMRVIDKLWRRAAGKPPRNE